jgi:glc operon protein GlcG
MGMLLRVCRRWPDSIMRMSKLISLLIISMSMTTAADLPTKKYLNLAAIKTLVSTAEEETKKRNVHVTICVVDESGNLLFLQKGDGAGLNTITFAQKKARYAAMYKKPSKAAADQLKGGDLQVLAFPDGFPNQGGLPILVEGQILGGIGVSGAASEVDEAIGQAAIDALLKP